MTGRLYVPLDVNYADDPKIVEAGPDAELLYLRALALAKRLEDDGIIHRGHLRRLGADLPAVNRGTLVDAIADRLVVTGLWTEHPDGYRITSWLDWNPSAAELDARRAAERARKDQYRKNRQGSNGTDSPDDDPDRPSGGHIDSKTGADDATNLSGRTPTSRDASVPPDTNVAHHTCPTGPKRSATRSEVKRSEVKSSELLRPLVRFASESDATYPQVAEVFQHWITATNRTTRTRLDTRRRNRILWALDHYPLPEILQAITHAAQSPWHAGQNNEGRRYDDLTLILRDAEHVERFRDQPTHIHARPAPNRTKGPPLWIIDDAGIAHRSEAS